MYAVTVNDDRGNTVDEIICLLSDTWKRRTMIITVSLINPTNAGTQSAVLQTGFHLNDNDAKWRQIEDPAAAGILGVGTSVIQLDAKTS